MTANTPLSVLNVDVSSSMAAVVTLVTVIVFGLATLARPTRATIVWGIAFAVGMLGTYLWIGGHQLGSPALTAGASGVMVCFEPLLWAGLRLYVGKRVAWWAVIGYLAVAPATLAITAGSEVFQIAFRVSFLCAAVFAGMIAYELFRLKRPNRDITLPLALASSGFVIIAVVGAVTALLDTGMTAAEQLDVLRGVNGVGTLVSSTCAAFTIVLLVRTDIQAPVVADDVSARARRRLLKAQAQGETVWSILDVSLDDQSDLREAYPGAAFTSILDRFAEDVFEALPVSADAECVDGGRCVVIIRGSDEAVQHHIRRLLDRISTIHDDGPAASIRVSASVGWASVLTFGYDYDVLVEAASEAVGRARVQGGDRWERAEVAAAQTDDGASRVIPANLER